MNKDNIAWKSFITFGYLETIINKYSGAKFSNGKNIFYFKNILPDGTPVKILNHIGLRTTNLSVAFINNTADTNTIQFNTDDKFTSGYLRNIYINVDVVKSSFENADTLRSAIITILDRINSVFLGYWDFHLSLNESGQYLYIIDKNYVDKNIYNILKNTDSEKIYTFPIYGGNSVITSLNMTSKLSTEIGLTSLYSVNSGENNKYILNSDSDAYTSIWKNKSNNIIYKDKFLGNLSINKEVTGANKTHTKLESTRIRDEIKQITKEINSIDTKNISYTNYVTDPNYTDEVNAKTDHKIDLIKKKKELSESLDAILESEYTEYSNSRIFNSADNIRFSNGFVKSFLPLKNVGIFFNEISHDIRLKHNDVDVMRMLIYRKSDPKEQTGKSIAIIPIDFELTMDGISGLRLGDIFSVDVLPSAYKNNSVLQIMGLTHTISKNYWSVTLNAKLRIASFSDKPNNPSEKNTISNSFSPQENTKYASESDNTDSNDILGKFEGTRNLQGLTETYSVATLSFNTKDSNPTNKLPAKNVDVKLKRGVITRQQIKQNLTGVVNNVIIPINKYFDTMLSGIGGKYYFAKVNQAFRAPYNSATNSSHQYGLAVDLSFWEWDKYNKKPKKKNSNKDTHVKIVNILVNNVLNKIHTNQILCEFNRESLWLHVDISSNEPSNNFNVMPKSKSGTMNAATGKFFNNDKENIYYNPYTP